MRDYGIGLDIGISSVGWAVVALDDNENPMGIVNMGSRIFDTAEQPKTGASLAAPRREARSARRRLRRHRHRNERIRKLITESGVLTQEELDGLYNGVQKDVYELRVRALDEKVSREDFVRILIHLSQRRGFKSNRKNAADGEDGKLLTAVNENKKRMEEHGWRTAGEMLYKDEFFSEHKRNVGGEYLSTLSRDMIENEAKAIFSAQRKFGADFAAEVFENSYLNILLSQRSFDEGPGGNSPYGGSQIEKMIGYCPFEKDQLRAAKATYSFEYFNLLQKVNHIRLLCDGESVPLSEGQRKKLIELAHKVASLNYSRIRKELGISENQRFNTLRYPAGAELQDVEKKEKFCYLKAYHEIRKAVEKNGKGRFALITKEQLNSIGTILSTYKSSENVQRKLREAGIEEYDIKTLEALNFSGFGHLSVKALDKITPYLEKGMVYSDACKEAGYDFRGHSSKNSRLLPPLSDDNNEITSPVVLRAVSQTIKVVNAIIRKQEKSPMFINIELAREMAKDFSERKKLEKDMETNRKKNEAVMDRIRTEYKVSHPSGIDLVKLKLFEEQDGRCAYSLKPISISRLFEPGYAEIDHIVPYSISFDDSYKNKVLVLTEENRNKGNRLPLQYLSGKKRDDFIVWVQNNVRNYRKRDLLLKEQLSEEELAGFKERNLQDTKTMSRFMQNYIRDNLEFAPSAKGRKKRVTAVNGAVTSYMRKRWGITKIREDGDLHHAVDALVIACTTDSLIQKVTKYSRYRECRYVKDESGSYVYSEATGEVLDKFPYPWPHFRKELEARMGNDPSKLIADLRIPFYMEQDAPEVKPLFVSRMPNRKVGGAAHKDTVKSARYADEGILLVKTPLTKLSLDKEGEIANYFNPDSDRLLYEALKERLAAFDGKGEKAFAEPFHKPKRDGTPGPVVKSVRLKEKSTLNVPVQGKTAVADNDKMVRLDVFKVEGDGYYFVPIYVADTLKKELPNKACVAGKSFNEWKTMNDSDFVFSLCSNDLVKVTHKKTITLSVVNSGSSLAKTYSGNEMLLYYKGANINSGAVKLINHDNSYCIESMGVKTLKSIEKYTVDILGEYHPVRKEKRQPFNIGGK